MANTSENNESSYSQTQIGTSEIWYSSNKTIIGNSGNLLEPYECSIVKIIDYFKYLVTQVVTEFQF